MTAVFHTEDLNSYGFWILLAGMDLLRYKKNPVLLYSHNGEVMSVGKVNNLRVEKNQLVGEVEFDEEDPIGKELKRKYEKGYMSGFSIGFKPVEISDDKKYYKKGQIYSTVTKSELYEISAVNIPSNQNAIKMYSDAGMQLDVNQGNIETFIHKLNTKSTKMKEVALKLGLPESATETEILSAVNILLGKVKQADELKVKNAEIVFGIGKSSGVVTPENETDFKQLAEIYPDLALKLFAVEKTTKGKKPEEQETKLSDVINNNSRPNQKTKKWDELTETELEELYDKNIKEYKRLFAEHYGYEPTIEA